MKTHTQNSVRNHERGSALVTVIILTFALALLAGAITQSAMNERRQNARNGYWLEARNAAEAVAEYGCYQVAQAFGTKANPSFGPSGTNPVAFPSSLASSFFAGTHVDTSSLEVRAGNVQKIPASGQYYVDPNDPNNRNDPFRQMRVYRRDVTVIAKATVNPPAGGGGPITAYVEEKVSVRGAPLLAYAIFYSGNDLEFGETPKMDIYGPVHVNGNLFVAPSGPRGSTPQDLGLHGPVSASGNVFHAWRGTTSTAQEGGALMSSTAGVYFSTDGIGLATGTMKNMLSGGKWYDSTMGADAATSGLSALNDLVTSKASASFSQYATQLWHGNLQTQAMGIEPYNPMGFSEVVGQLSTGSDLLATDGRADIPANVGSTTDYGYGPHSLIEPALDAPASTDPYKDGKQAVEDEKLARKAGLYIKVSSDPVTGNVTIAMYGDPHSVPATYTGTDIAKNGGIRLATVPANVVTYNAYTTSSNKVKSGIYDQRQDKGVNLVRINLAALSTALGNVTSGVFKMPDGTTWGPASGGSGHGFDTTESDSTGWNGGVYIDVDQPPSTTGKQTAVIFTDGMVKTAGTSLIPTTNGVDGLTIATNAPAYILGSLNTNGTVTSASNNNSAMYPDDSPGTAPLSSKETPLAIAADAITVLSDTYFGGSGSNPNYDVGHVSSSSSGYNSFTQSSAPSVSSGNVEIAAALITGTVSTSADSSGTQMYSGGVHNLPRFLENWGSNTVAIRGSMISMFNSKVATAGWAQSYYSAPVRQWGFDKIFEAGRYPPIIPQVLLFRRADFTFINGDTYTAHAAAL